MKNKIQPFPKRDFSVTMNRAIGFPFHIFFKHIPVEGSERYFQLTMEGSLLSIIEATPESNKALERLIYKDGLTLYHDWEEIKLRLKEKGLLPNRDDYIPIGSLRNDIQKA